MVPLAVPPVMLYDQLIAQRDRHQANIRLDRVWRLGGILLSVRNDFARIHAVNGKA